jgi:hypothetical protein
LILGNYPFVFPLLETAKVTVFADNVRPSAIELPVLSVTTSAQFASSDAPKGYLNVRNFPNPFNSSTTITFDIRVISDVSIAILNAVGQTVMSAALPPLAQGPHRYTWDASKVSSGVYFCVVNVGGSLGGRKMIVAR